MKVENTKQWMDEFTKRHLLAWCSSFFYAEEYENMCQQIWDYLKTLGDDDRGYLIDKGWVKTYESFCKQTALDYQ